MGQLLKTHQQGGEAFNVLAKSAELALKCANCTPMHRKLNCQLSKQHPERIGNTSQFPWYEKNRKWKDIAKEGEEKEAKQQKKKAKELEAGLKESTKKHKAYLKKLSEEVHLRRVYESNKEPDCDETYEEYVARKEKRKKMKERKKLEEEQARKEEEEEQRKSEEEIAAAKKKKEKKEKEGDESKDGKDDKKDKKDKKDDKKKKKKWPGGYPTSVTQDFITVLKMIIEAEYETQQPKKLPPRKPSSKKDRLVKEFTSFLDVLFNANEMMKEEMSDKKGKDKDSKDKSGASESDAAESDAGEETVTKESSEKTEAVPEEAEEEAVEAE